MPHPIVPITLDRAYLKHRLMYDHETGLLIWKAKPVERPQDTAWNTKYAGVAAGCFVDWRDYVDVLLDGRRYLAHRLIWYYVTGESPDVEIDHADLNKKNNRWSNLRLATRSQNAMNMSRYSHNSSGFKGVSWQKSTLKWEANICSGGVKTFLGLHDSPEAAYAAYVKAAGVQHRQFARVV